MSSDPALTPQPSPAAVAAPTPHRGKRIASAVLSSALVLFAVVFAPVGIMAATAAEPLGDEWSTGSNMINVVFAWVFGVALLVFAGLGGAAIAFAGAGRSTGLVIYAVVVTVLLVVGAAGFLTAGVIMISG